MTSTPFCGICRLQHVCVVQMFEINYTKLNVANMYVHGATTGHVTGILMFEGNRCCRACRNSKVMIIQYQILPSDSTCSERAVVKYH